MQVLWDGNRICKNKNTSHKYKYGMYKKKKKKIIYIYVCVCVCVCTFSLLESDSQKKRLLEADPYLSIVSQKKKKKIYLLLM